MEEQILTKDASSLLDLLYTEYKKRLKQGLDKTIAANFESSKTIQRDLVPEWSFDTVDSACAELRYAGLLRGLKADGYEYHVTLSDKGIIYGETKFPRAASKAVSRVFEVLQAIRSLLPW